MPAVSRSTQDPCTGHGCFPPRPSSAGSSDVKTNSKKTLRLTDMYELHACPNSPPHSGSVAKGSATVNANGLSVAREADPISCGSYIKSGSGNVNAGDSAEKFVPPEFPDIPFNPYPSPRLRDSSAPNPGAAGERISPEDAGELPEHAEYDEQDPETELSAGVCGEMPLKNPCDVAVNAMNSKYWGEKGHNPNIVALWEEIGYNKGQAYSNGNYVAWCAVFTGATLKRAGCKYKQTAGARNYKNYGQAVSWDDIRRGDVIVLWRKSIDDWRGHVGFATGNKTDTTIEIIGGNQGDNLTIRNYSRYGKKGGFLAARRPVSCVDGTTPVPESGSVPSPSSGEVVSVGEGAAGKVT